MRDVMNTSKAPMETVSHALSALYTTENESSEDGWEGEFPITSRFSLELASQQPRIS